MAEPERINALIEALADGTAVDWADAESTAQDEWERAVIRRLGRIGQVADLQRRPRPLPTPADGGTARSSETAPAVTWSHLVLLEKIGEGAFGEVYRAHDPRLARDVALKLFYEYEPLAMGQPPASAVIEEGRLLARVRHPNAVTVHGADRSAGRVGIWMDLIRGRTLEHVLRDHGPLSPQEATVIGLDLCRALAAVHQAGLVHGDVKARNVMREDGGRVVLMDFGAGRDREDLRRDGAAPTLAGTPIYLAPEVLLGGRVSVRSDLYSLGVLLYYLVTNEYPIAARTRADIEDAHRCEQRIRLRDVRPDLPARFVQVVERALSADSESRYGSAGEMEAALSDTAANAAPSDISQQPQVGRAPWKAWVAAAALVVVASAAVATVIAMRDPAIPFEARDQILVAAFKNNTGEPQWDGVIEAALEYELVNSRFVTVVPQNRVDDMLTLMRKPVETQLEVGVARELAQRDGAIRAVVGGRLDKIGSRYVLMASVMAPAGGFQAASVREDVAEPADLPAALRRLSNSLRGELGEARGTIRASDEQLEKVTTPSFQALRWYSQSYALGYRENWPAALEFARRAVEADPEFASAQIWLAWCLMRNPARTPEVGVERRATAARAVELARQATDWERYWIEGSALIMFDDPALRDEAVAKYKALLEIAPTHFWGLNNLITGLRAKNRVAEAVPYAIAAVERQPNDIKLVTRTCSLFVEVGDLRRAREYADRVINLSTAAGSPIPPTILWFPAVAASHRGDISSTVRELDALEASLSDGRPRAERDEMAAWIADWHLGLGRPRSAARVIATLADANEREFLLARTAFFTDDLPSLREHSARVQIRHHRSGPAAVVNPRVRPLDVMFLQAKAGFLRQVEAQLVEMERLYVGPRERNEFDMLRACISLERRDPGRTLALVASVGAQVFRPGRTPWADDCEAEARYRRGEIDQAVAALQWWETAPSGGWSPSPLLTRNQVRLAELYQAAGRQESARSLTDFVANTLSQAEPDFPLLERLRRLHQALASAPLVAR